jgi:uncharacterized coiled-coil protein SlyX
MNETWSLIRNITEVIGMFAIPIFTWVVYTLIQQGKQIIVLEQKVNEQLGEKIKQVESKITGVESVIEEIRDNVVENKILLNAQATVQNQIGDKFDTLISKFDHMNDKRK